jgi:DNA-binding transcriptional MerR regulator
MSTSYERIRELLIKQVGTFRNHSEAARAIGVHPSTVHRWIKGERGRNMTTESLINALNRMGVSMAEIGEVLMANERDGELLADIADLIDDDRKLVEAFTRLKGLDADKRKRAVEFLELIGSGQT